MNKKNLLSGREKELLEMAEQYEQAKADNKHIYLDADDLADLADWYAMHRKYDIAKEVTIYGLSLHPNNTPLLVEQAYLYLDTSNKAKAQEIANSITESTSETIILRAQLLLEEGKLDDADLLLDTIEDKEDLANIVEASYIFIDMGYPERAVKWLEKGKGKYDEEEAFLAVCADCYYAQRELDKSSEYYNKLIDRNPYSPAYWYGLARCYFDQEQFDKALEACDYAIVSDDDFVDAYIMKGNAFYELGNEEKALENYKQAEKRQAIPTYFIDSFIGTNKLTEGEWEIAYNHFLKAIENVSPQDQSPLPSLYANVAFCLHKMKKAIEAGIYWEKSHQLAPTDPNPYLIEGRCYMDDDDFQMGMACWSKAIQIAPYADTWNEIGSDCMELGQLEYARIAFEHVKELEPNFNNINEKLTIVFMLMHDKDNFQKYNQQCKHPMNSEKLENLYRQLKNIDKDNMAQTIKKIFDSLY